jgi:integrase
VERNLALTDTTIRNAKPAAKPYKLYDRDRLFLLVHPNGSKYWRLRYKRNGKEKVISLGAYPSVTLAKARGHAQEVHDLLVNGLDPAEQWAAQQTQTNVPTFESVARDWLARKKGKLSPSYFVKIEQTLHANLFPRLGEKPIREVTAGMVLDCLRAMEARGAVELARRCKAHAAAIFNYAAALELVPVGYNPARGLTRDVLEHHAVKHFPHLAEAELGEFLRALAEYPGRPETRLAVKLLLLTFVRPGELRAAKWEEFDLGGDAPVWRIPAERMKMRFPHVVPLSRQAIEALKELQLFTGHSPYLFPGGRGRLPYMSENTINKAIALIGYKGRVVGHGFRATASTILNESREFHPDAIERQLAHKDRNEIRAIYDRAEHLDERRRLMQWWADKLDALATANVIPLRQAG